ERQAAGEGELLADTVVRVDERVAPVHDAGERQILGRLQADDAERDARHHGEQHDPPRAGEREVSYPDERSTQHGMSPSAAFAVVTSDHDVELPNARECLRLSPDRVGPRGATVPFTRLHEVLHEGTEAPL